jgi:hypothetical protein
MLAPGIESWGGADRAATFERERRDNHGFDASRSENLNESVDPTGNHLGRVEHPPASKGGAATNSRATRFRG